MVTKVDSPSSVEPRRGQSTVSVSASSTVPTNSPKVSMFAAKSGFVIPKNKLSGSLVPIFRGGGKVDAGNTVKEESTIQLQRKTKWGPDLTQDAAVRKAKALAYQTRVEQITQLLKSGTLEIGDDEEGSRSPRQDSDHHLASDHDDKKAQKFELLELERCEIIGEILRLNPNYKAPPDYKPLLKEGKVPIPVKAYPGYNFIGLLLGPESNTQKRLEEETGAKIRVYGTKANSKEKREITQTDIAEAQGDYEDLYVNVSADTYEKVDVAVALIELLVTPVSGNAAVTSKNPTSENQDPAPSAMIMPGADVNQGVPQPILVPVQSGQSLFHQPYPSPWFHVPSRLPSGFMPLSLPNNPIRFPPSVGPPNASPYFGQPHPFGSVPRTSSSAINRPQLPMQGMQQPPLNQAIPTQNRPLPGLQPPSGYPVMSTQPTSTSPSFFAASRPVLAGTVSSTRPPPPMHSQPGSMARPLATPPASGNSPRWSAAPNVPPPQRPHMMPPQSLNPPVRPQQAPLSSPRPNMPNNIGRPPTANFTPTFVLRPSTTPPFNLVPPQITPVSAPAMISSSGAPLQAPMPPPSSIPSAMNSPVLRPLPVAAASLVPMRHPPSIAQTAPSVGLSAPLPTQIMASSRPVAPAGPQPPRPVPSLAPRPAQQPLQSPQPPPCASTSTSGNMPSFSPINPPTISPISAPQVTTPKPLRPSSGDFTFHPLRAQVPASSTAPRPNSPSVPLAAPQAPSFRPALQSAAPSVSPQGIPRPSAVNQMVLGRAPVQPSPSPVSPFLPSGSAAVRPPPRFPFPSSNPVPPISPATQMRPPSFSPATQQPIRAVQPANLLQPHQNQLPLANRPSGLVIPSQQLGSNPPGYVAAKVPSAPGGNQIYDPFSPTSISPAPSQQGGEPIKARKPETDAAEYEDLIASVGVK